MRQSLVLEHLPLRLGFFLAETGLSTHAWRDVDYCGVDRHPRFPASNESPGSLEMIAEEARDVWEAYVEASDSEELNTELACARYFQREIQNLGVEAEIIYVEVLAVPKDITAHELSHEWMQRLTEDFSQWAVVHEKLTRRPTRLQKLGIDVSYPVPSFHSAIYQPGLEKTVPNLPDYLNEFGLVDELDTALALAERANQLESPWRPFCAIGVWRSS